MTGRLLSPWGIPLLIFVLTAADPATSAEPALAVWHFDENTGQVVTDATGRGNDGKVSGAVWVGGKQGAALEFDGRSFIEIPYEAGFVYSNYLRLEAWIKPKVLAGSQTIISKYEEEGNLRSFRLTLTDGQVTFSVTRGGDGSGLRSIAADRPVPAGKWSHVSAVFDGGEMTLLIDGAVAARKRAEESVFCSTAALQIGRYCWGKGATHYFQGVIDEVRITGRQPFLAESGEPAIKGELVLAGDDFSNCESAKPFATDEIGRGIQRKGSYGSPNWQPVLGRWEIREGESRQLRNDDKPYLAAFGDATWKDYVFSALGRIDGGGARHNIGLAFRLQPAAPGFYPPGGYFFTADEETGLAVLYRWQQSEGKILPDRDHMEVLAEARVSIPSAKVHHLKVRCAGARISGFVNGKRVLFTTDDAFLAGNVGLAAFGARGTFDNAMVLALSGPELAEDAGVAPASPGLNEKVAGSNPPVFRWKSDDDSWLDRKTDYSYEVQISQDPGFAQVEFSASKILAAEFRPAEPLAAGKWYWRVRRMCPRGCHVWTSPTAFEMAAEPRDCITPPIIRSLSPTHFASPMPEWTAIVDDGREGAFINPDGVRFLLDGEPLAGECRREETKFTLRPARELSQGPHELRVIATDEGGAHTERKFIVVRTQATSHVALRPDGVLIVDGKPFFAVGTYRDPDDNIDSVTLTVEAGFNLTHSYWFEENRGPEIHARHIEYLNRAQQNGLMVFMGLPRSLVYSFAGTEGEKRDEAADEIRRITASRMESPALLSPFAMEEPDGGPWGIGPRTMRALRDLMKEVDPFHPVNTLVCTARYYRDYRESCDIFWVDVYPLPFEPIVSVYDNVLRASRETGKPVWAVIQGHDYSAAPYRDARLPRPEAHRPTPDELRCMTYLAVCAGARGIIYYWWNNTFYHMKHDMPHMWDALKRMTHELKTLAPVLTTDKPGPAVKSSEFLKTWSGVLEGSLYVIAVNPTDTARDGWLMFDSGAERGSLNEVFHTDKTVRFRTAKQSANISWCEIVDEFPAHGVRIYKLSP